MNINIKLLYIFVQKVLINKYIVTNLVMSISNRFYFWKVANFSSQYWFTYNSKLNNYAFNNLRNL
jgi:hypothetical protein